MIENMRLVPPGNRVPEILDSPFARTLLENLSREIGSSVIYRHSGE
jgi:hypothetical protein